MVICMYIVSIFANIDEFEGLLFKANVDDDHILFVLLPLVTPQPALNPRALFKLSKLGMLSRIFKLYKDALKFLQTLHFVLPNFKLHANRGDSILTTQAK